MGKNEIVGKPPPETECHNTTLVTGLRKNKEDEFDGIIPEDCFIDDYEPDDLAKILEEQQKMMELLQAHGKTKHLANRMLIIFDDLVGSSLYSGSRANPFKKLNTNHRHYSTSILMVSQAYKEIQKTVRTNFTCLIVFEIFNEKETEAIMEEYPMGMKKDQWYQAYEYCVKLPHSFLFYNIMKPKELRLMRNFSEIVFFKNEKHIEEKDT